MEAAFRGLSYAASGAADAYDAAKQVAVKHTLKVSVHKSSAADQYAPTPKPHKKHKKSHPVAGVNASRVSPAPPQASAPVRLFRSPGSHC